MDYLARVSEVSEDRSTARVIPLTADGLVTRHFPIHWTLRYGEGLQIGETVVCLQFADDSGLVLCRPNGEWTHVIGGSVEVTDDLYVDGNASAVNVTASGSVSASSVSAGSVTAGGVSLSSHTHTAYSPGDDTSGPH